jgi:RNA-directed DNA polymerase
MASPVRAGAAGQTGRGGIPRVARPATGARETLITHISRGFDFLGQNVRKYGDKHLIKPARKSVTSLLNKMREVLGKNKAATQAQVIILLNPILRGWAMCHRHIVAAATFSRIDPLV